MLFKEIIVLYSENHIKAINRFCGQNVDLLTDKMLPLSFKELIEKEKEDVREITFFRNNKHLTLETCTCYVMCDLHLLDSNSVFLQLSATSELKT